jgi:hypothetical protein
MVRVTTGGWRIDDALTIRSPSELHMPFDHMLDAELMAATLNVLDGNHDDVDASLARRLAIALTWLAQSWRNTESIRMLERVVMLKTAFEALTNESATYRSAGVLENMFGEMRADGVSAIAARDLLWSPNETASMTWVYKERDYPCTPLQHWFMSFGEARNAIVHEGEVATLVYDAVDSPYRGPYVFIGERLLREACRVALRRFGYDDLWKGPALRMLSRAFRERPQASFEPAPPAE